MVASASVKSMRLRFIVYLFVVMLVLAALRLMRVSATAKAVMVVAIVVAVREDDVMLLWSCVMYFWDVGAMMSYPAGLITLPPFVITVVCEPVIIVV